MIPLNYKETPCSANGQLWHRELSREHIIYRYL